MTSTNSTPAHHQDAGRAKEFAALDAGFRLAADRSGDIRIRTVSVAGATVRIEVVGSLLYSKLTMALAHLDEAEARSPALTIRAWDSATTGTALPEQAGQLEGHALRGLSPLEASERIHTGYLRGDSGLSMLDLGRDDAVYWVPDAVTIPGWDLSSPFRAILHWWTAARSSRFIHAAAIGTKDGAVLVVGKGGSGKSTTALACLRAGMLYVGDDYCVLEQRGGPRAHSLYSTSRLRLDNVPRFRELVAQLPETDIDRHEKLTLFLSPTFSAQLVQSMPVKAVLLPAITDRPKTSVESAGAAQALASLAPSTLLQLPAAAPGALRDMAALVKQLPCFQLRLGPDEREIPGVVTGLLARLGNEAYAR